MRKLLIFIWFVYFITVCSCKSYELNLNGKEYLSEDAIKSSRLSFINDSVCLYIQEYHCSMAEEYQKTEIKSKYRIDDNLIILTNPVSPKYLKGEHCNIIPDSILRTCDLIYNDTPEDPFILDKLTKWSKADAYGVIINVNESDTLLSYKNNIIYAKVLLCIPVEQRVASFIPFVEKGTKRISDKKLRKLMRAGKIPVNNNF